MSNSKTHLNQKELAELWGISTKTLEAWRAKGVGPSYKKLGNNIRYTRSDIENYETKNHCETRTD